MHVFNNAAIKAQSNDRSHERREVMAHQILVIMTLQYRNLQLIATLHDHNQSQKF